MDVQVENLDTHEARLTISIDPQTLKQAQTATTQRLSKNYRFPGFRPGMAPTNVVMQAFGADGFKQEMVDELARMVYPKALEQANINPYAPGSIEEYKDEPPTIIAKVPLMPVVDLKDYKSIRVPMTPPTVSDEEVQAQLEGLQKDNAIVNAVERAAQSGDMLEGKIVARNDAGEMLFDLQEKQFLLDGELDKVMHLSGLSDAIVGMSAGENKQVKLNIDNEEEDEELRGKEANIEIAVERVSSHELPPIDDTLAQTIGAFDSLDQLKDNLRTRLLEYKTQLAQREHTDKVIEAFAALSDFKLPPSYMDDRLNESVADLKSRVKNEAKMEYEDWLKLSGTTDEKVREDLRESAERQARTSLTLGGVRNYENITVSDDEVKAAIDQQIELAKQSGVDFRRGASKAEYRETMANRLLTDKVIARMVEIATGKAAESAS